jgi:hypothetical protein
MSGAASAPISSEEAIIAKGQAKSGREPKKPKAAKKPAAAQPSPFTEPPPVRKKPKG